MSAALPAPPPASGALWPGDFLTVCALTAGVALLIPYALISVLGGATLRTLYPAYILAASYFVIVHRRPLYPAFIVSVFAFAPFLRRVADYQAGFAVFNLILLAPYVGLLPTLPALLRRALSGGERNWPFSVILGCVVYAAFVAAFKLEFVASIYEAGRWLLPTALAAFIMAKPADAGAVRRAVVHALCLIVPILSVYGVFQYLVAPKWDVYWMWNIDNDTFGTAEPYRIRVFSMMNSPGSVAIFASYAMILLTGESLGPVAAAATGLPLLALTLIRTAWLSLAVGVVVLIARAGARRRLALLVGVVSVGIVGAMVINSNTMPAEIRFGVTDRFATFSDLGTDESADTRLVVYEAFFSRLSNNPLGEGFGANASTVTNVRTGRRDLASLDSGLLETFLVFGIPGATLYFAALSALLVAAWRNSRLGLGTLHGSFAVGCAAIAIMPLGTNYIGESGMLFWTAIGIILGNELLTAERRRHEFRLNRRVVSEVPSS